jgi:RNA polymerase sigma-70 factor (ECF subfamily)
VTLLQRVASGHDAAAWTEFADRYGSLIRGFARRQNLQPAECDDVVQAVLLALSQSMSGFHYDPERGKFRSYLKTIVLRTIFRDSRQNHPVVSLDSFESDTTGSAEAEDHWEAEWRQYHLRRAMLTVRQEFREQDYAAFDAYAIRGLDVSEVAATFDLSVDQVYQAKSRILKRLSQVVATQVDEEG